MKIAISTVLVWAVLAWLLKDSPALDGDHILPEPEQGRKDGAK